jgi:PAS domain S-box-containing protein
VLDERGVILTTNARWDALATAAGADPCATGQGANYLAVCDACDDPVAASVADAIRAIIAGRRTGFEIDYPCPTQDGRTLWFHLRALRFGAEGEDGSARVVVQHLDVTAHRSAEREAQLRSRLVDEVTAAVVATDREGHITEWSRGAEELHGWTREEAVGRDVVVLAVAPPDRAAARDAFRGIVEAGRAEVELTLGHRDGSTFPAYVRAAAICDDAGRRDRLRLRLGRHHRARALRARAALGAGVPAGGRRQHGRGPLHPRRGRPPDVHERGGRADPRLAARELAGRDMQEAVDCLHGEDMRVREDAFVRRDGSVVPVECTSSPFETPAGVRGSVIVFSDITERKREHERLAREVEDLTWLTRIRDALEHDRFRLHAQPIIDLSSGAAVQHELLIRMLDEDGSLVAPGLFLPVAERYGVIREIDRWVVGEAVAIAARGIPIELNLSAASIGDRELAGIFERDLEAFGADPSLIVVELTETALLADEDAGCSFVARLASLGCKIALDDFGTGYGGFTYLKRLPVDHLKIDIEFVRDLPRDMASQHVVRAVVNLARGFGQTTVAEGVEDDETLELLRELGVDCAQGYGIGRPAPVEQVFAAWPSA